MFAEIQLRVRALEAERALGRVAVSRLSRLSRLLLGSARLQELRRGAAPPAWCAACPHASAPPHLNPAMFSFFSFLCYRQVTQKAVLSALGASMLVNMGTVFRWGWLALWQAGLAGWLGWFQRAAACRRRCSGGAAAARGLPPQPPAQASLKPPSKLLPPWLATAPPPPRPRSVSAMATAASLSFGGAALLGLATLASLLKVRGLEKKEAQLTGAA